MMRPLEITFVNHAGLAQAIRWAIAPLGACRSDGQVFLDLLGRRGLVHAPSVRGELAREVAYFARLMALDESSPEAVHHLDPSGYYSPPGKGGPREYGVWLERRD